VTVHLTVIPGDGIGPEIMDATLRILSQAGAQFRIDRQLAGVAAVAACGVPLPDATVESIRRTGLVLKGPLETPVGNGFRSINVGLRTTFDLFANVRPIRTLLPSRRGYDALDLVLIRENTEGMYVGVEHYIPIGNDPRAAAEATAIITRAGSERIVRYAFEYALAHGRRTVTLVHKANILKCTSGLFLDIGREIAGEYAGRIAFEERIVDAIAMNLVIRPETFDVIVTTNLFGDILSDLMAGLVGGLGLAPGANIGAAHAMFEAVHGTAPDIVGRGIANPSALLLAGCLLLDHVGDVTTANRVRAALGRTLDRRAGLTPDLGGSGTTATFTAALLEQLTA
jgi:isocitrate dehydrogenase (NAD+)